MTRKSYKSILRKKVKATIEICPEYWFHLKNNSIVPDTTFAFYQTLELRFGVKIDRNIDYKFIRKIFHEIYINEYNGIYKLNLSETYQSPVKYMIGIKNVKHHKNNVKYSKNISITKRLENIRKRK